MVWGPWGHWCPRLVAHSPPPELLGLAKLQVAVLLLPTLVVLEPLLFILLAVMQVAQLVPFLCKAGETVLPTSDRAKAAAWELVQC